MWSFSNIYSPNKAFTTGSFLALSVQFILSKSIILLYFIKYLVSGISLLQNDPYLQVKLGGVSLNNAGYIANALKSKVAELELEQRIKTPAEELLKAQYGTEKLKGLAPTIGNDTVKAGLGGGIKIKGQGVATIDTEITNKVIGQARKDR